MLTLLSDSFCPMPRNKQKRRYKDTEHGGYKDDNGSSSEEEDIQIIPTTGSKSQQTRRGAETKETSTRVKCWRYLLLAITCSLAIALCVNLWASWGDWVQDSIWPPRVAAAGVVCGNGTVGEGAYQVAFHKFEVVHNESTAGWVHLNATKPPTSVLWAYDSCDDVEEHEIGEGDHASHASHANPQLLDVHWRGDDRLLVWLPKKEDCATVMVFST